MKETITRICQNCNVPFSVLASEYRSSLKKKYAIGKFCCHRCYVDFRIANTPILKCTNCNKEFSRSLSKTTNSKKSKTKFFFCSHSCAATYSNTHKTTGNRRSKLEAHLESQLRSEFPNLELICNGKEAIGSELDFYFPQLRLAIELNGIFHYEPIYGVDKLERMQANDQQKGIACNAAGIELCVIPCTEKHITANVKERYWSIIRNLVTPLLKRASNTDVQVS